MFALLGPEVETEGVAFLWLEDACTSSYSVSVLTGDGYADARRVGSGV